MKLMLPFFRIAASLIVLFYSIPANNGNSPYEPLKKYFHGLMRKRGTCTGCLALQAARHGLPILSKYVSPSAKCVGKKFSPNLFENLKK